MAETNLPPIDFSSLDNTLAATTSVETRNDTNELVETKELLDEQERYLRGQIKKRNIKSGDIEYNQVRNPIMNEKGISLCMGALNSICGPNSGMSVNSLPRIQRQLEVFGETLWSSICINKEAFEISDEDFAELPARIIHWEIMGEESLKRGLNGSEQGNIYGGKREILMRQEAVGQQQKGFIESLGNKAAGVVRGVF